LSFWVEVMAAGVSRCFRRQVFSKRSFARVEMHKQEGTGCDFGCCGFLI
jgi:hypothetical protein